MSEYRVGIIAEGPTDIELIREILRISFPKHSFVFAPLFPSPEELSMQKAKAGGFGWGGVYRACRELRDLLKFSSVAGKFDFLIIHVDGDVAYHSYEDAGIHDVPNDLPCGDRGDEVASVCERLDHVLLTWIGEIDAMPRIVFCTPHMATETWAGALVFPEEWEEISEYCDDDVVYLKLIELGRPKAEKVRRLMRKSRDGKNRKVTSAYARIKGYITFDTWQSVVKRYSQAKKFDDQLKTAVSVL